MESALEFGFNTPFLSGLLSIILIAVILSGDNSIVIALAVRTLPAEKRRLGILIGAGAAALMRVIFTLIATHLMQVPYLKLIGGLLILWIGIKLLSENQEGDYEGRPANGRWQAFLCGSGPRLLWLCRMPPSAITPLPRKP